ncbi:MAG: type II toxin-antitoxin system RelE/ParE family toxin [Firmicutes bacterium]|nr:type II toxin-antitoxin system RelE/ParE family toxin [Bacillota bacterium]
MDSFKVNITKQAEESMHNIALYIAQNLMNVSAAEGHVDAILNAIEELSYRASTVKTIPEQPWGEMGFRRISVKNYYVYFKIYEDRHEVSVLDVIYQGRDQRNGLREGGYKEANPERF